MEFVRMIDQLRPLIKSIILWSHVNLVAPIANRIFGLLGRQRIVVLLYHRVNDELKDSVTVGIEQFDQQMSWLAEHYSLVGLDEAVHGHVDRHHHGPLVAVTFDDGYLDNYENAVPIMSKYHIPATFFVSTGMIGTKRPFQHDINKLGRRIPAMTWDQLRDMRDQGFHIGSHSVNHVNLAQIDIAELRYELTESRDTLTGELQIESVHFAYPFGGKSDITLEALKLIKEAGYVSCSSAYGGRIAAEVETFKIPRVNINWNFSMLAFRARIEGF